MTTVLIVDDNPQDAYLLRCVLAGEELEFAEARNGREALACSEAHAIDLVISDILMPVMDGFSLCRAWKSDPRWRSIPFVFYTATYVDKKDEDLALGLGADLFLVKPADPAELRSRVAEMLARRRGGQPAREAAQTAEVPLLQEYNAVLIHKLEQKLLALERANQDLRLKDLALASSASGILLGTAAGQVAYANASMARLCGRPVSDLLGQDLARLFAPSEELPRLLAREVPASPVELQLAPALPDGPAVWARVTAHEVTDGDGGRMGVMLSCLDVSEQKRLRRELSRVQRLEALSLFAAGVAHDFNNLLSAMYVGLELGSAEPSADPERRADRELALAAFERARELTRRLLSFSKGDRAARRAVDLRQLLDETITLALSGSSMRCERRYASSAPSAWIDPGQLAQVFMNLLVNARQATGGRGGIVVSVSETLVPASGPLPAGRYVSVEIQDDGPGIAPEALAHLFEPFYTTKPQGCGLGLATSQAIVQAHGGRLSTSSREGAGATFQVVLPVSGESPYPERNGDRAPACAAPARILVMDDQLGVQALLQRGLERSGHSVVVTGNGEQALLEFERAWSEGRRFELAILDITVRGGMGGIETLAKLRRRDRHLPAIAVTGYSDEAAKDELRARGFARVLPKPFLLHELLATIDAALPASE